MALVLYDSSVKGARQQDDYKLIREKLEMLMSEQREKPYLGLSNQGATCYMNSLLQALFMTPEVRSQIYSYNQIPGQNEILNSTVAPKALCEAVILKAKSYRDEISN